MAKTGRPSKLTPELADEIARRIQAGCFPSVAAGSVGIAARTFYRWLAEGRRQWFWVPGVNNPWLDRAPNGTSPSGDVLPSQNPPRHRLMEPKKSFRTNDP